MGQSRDSDLRRGSDQLCGLGVAGISSLSKNIVHSSNIIEIDIYLHYIRSTVKDQIGTSLGGFCF